MKLRLALLMGTVGLSVAFAGCVDNGNKLEQLRFTTSTNYSVARTDAQTVYLCSPDRPILIGQFTDGSLGEFTQRVDVKYTSSDETKLRVSDGTNIQVPGTTSYYARGVLVPVATTRSESSPGVGSGADTPVTISAEFAGLRASTQIAVHGSGKPEISSYLPGSSDLFLAPGTCLGLKATTLRDGRTVDITQTGSWKFTPAIDSSATIGEITGVIVAKSPVAATTSAAAIPVPEVATSASFTLPACPTVAEAPQPDPKTVTVENPTSIVSEREFPGLPLLRSTTPNMATSDQLITTANFAGGQTQDVTYLVAVTVTTTMPPPTGTPPAPKNVVPVGSLLIAGDETEIIAPSTTPTVIPPVTVKTSLATQQAGVPANVDYTLETFPGSGVNEEVSTIVATIKSIVVTDDSLTTLYDVNTGPEINAFGDVQLRALGRFDDPDDGSATLIERDITRHMTATNGWSVGDTSVLFAGNTFGSSIAPDGKIISLKDAAGCVTVTANTGLADSASSTVGATIQAFAQVRVKPTTGSAPAAGCTPSTTPTS